MYRRLVASLLLAQLATCTVVADLKADIDKLLQNPALAHSITGILVVSLKDGKTLYEQNADVMLIPASNQKLLVSAAALHRLGADFRFTTRLWATGEVDSQGVLQGDLILQGSGDPTLLLKDIEAMAEAVQKAGIRGINGYLLYDESAFDGIRRGWDWAWDDEPYYYSPCLSAICVERNAVTVYVSPGENVGDPPRVRLFPPTDYLLVRNEATTSAAGTPSTIYVTREHARNIAVVRGQIPVDARADSARQALSVEEPPRYAMWLLREALQRRAISTPYRTALPERVPAGARLLYTHTSPPLSDILPLLNKPSDNLIAECLMRALGVVAHREGSAAAGERVMLEFLKEAGLNLNALNIIDGSGLSRRNQITARNLVTLLRYMTSHPQAKAFIESLPVAGMDGTLRNRMVNTPAQGKVRAKTGSLGRVSTLAGYLTTQTGEELVFALLMNNYNGSAATARAVQDAILVRLVQGP
ncbi:MAG: D-alanyl-D-alanine carboxypeptidase/D-alanyl-D-alanine-endopeptidase [Armatimonadota bacterium]|nr:D-alanyl-D-alanine carboxypeptidase/D-alanyl-D-alanine-endopeptidase [bacterium]MDW8321091.1 D-alanyl-D-alanine carboxypeptidase/D-alanyl-D-alanine-endopeptidase [Armatimonadota bacterium]